MEKEWNIIYEDAELIVTYKPSDLAVQTSKMGQKDLVSMLKNDRVKKKEPPYVAVINRLDQPVEGLVLFAKTKEAAASKCCRLLLRAFSEQYIIQAGIQDFK